MGTDCANYGTDVNATGNLSRSDTSFISRWGLGIEYYHSADALLPISSCLCSEIRERYRNRNIGFYDDPIFNYFLCFMDGFFTGLLGIGNSIGITSKL